MCRCVTHSVCKNFSLCVIFSFVYSFFLCVNLFTFFWRVWLFIQYCTFKFLLHCILTSVCSVFFHVCASLCLSLFLLSFFLLSVQHNFCQNNMEQWGEEEEGSNKNFQQKNLFRNVGSFTCNVKMPHLASFSNDFLSHQIRGLLKMMIVSKKNSFLISVSNFFFSFKCFAILIFWSVIQPSFFSWKKLKVRRCFFEKLFFLQNFDSNLFIPCIHCCVTELHICFLMFSK